MLKRNLIYFLLVSTITTSCSQKADNKVSNETPEKIAVAKSISGKPFYEPKRTIEEKAVLDQKLEEARQNFNSSESEINYIWLGRRLAYLSRYPDAIQVYSEGLKRYSESYKLYRHRGHRYISIREFDKAVSDFKKAAELMPKNTIEIELDGIPNTLNRPLSSTQFNIWYHLGLAYYLKGEYRMARSAYLNCLEFSINHDLLVATVDWLYMTYQRLGDQKKASSLLYSISDSLNIIENDSYYQRLKLYKNQISPDQILSIDTNKNDYDLVLATQGYGLANYYLTSGDTLKTKNLLRTVLEGQYWSAFGYIAAEVDWERLKD